MADPKSSRIDRINNAYENFVLSNEKTRTSTSLSNFKRKMDTFYEDGKARGFDPRELNRRIAGSIANLAINSENENYLQLLSLIEAGPNAPYSNTLAGKDLIRNTESTILQQKITRENREWNRHQRGQSLIQDEARVSLGSLRNKLITGEFQDIGQYEEAVSPIRQQLNADGLLQMVKTDEEWVSTYKDTGKKPAKVTMASPEVKELYTLAETATSVADLARWELENNKVLDPDLNQALTKLIEYNRSIPKSPVETTEYKTFAPELEGLLSAPAAQNVTTIQKLLEGFEGVIRDPTPPEYFVVRAEIERDFKEKVQMLYRDAQIQGNPEYSQWTPEQRSVFSANLVELLKAQKESYTERLQNVITEYNNRVTKDAQELKRSKSELNNARGIAGILGDPTLVNSPSALGLTFDNQVKALFDTTFFGSPTTNLGKYLDGKVKAAGYSGLDDKNAGPIIKDLIKQMSDTIRKGQ